MSYPMNEFVTDLETPDNVADKWIATSAASVGDVNHRAGQGLISFMSQSRRMFESARKAIGEESRAAHAFIHDRQYIPVLASMVAGMIVGYIMSSKMKKIMR
jgi:ElaB/YqjD/DUF883 family membrane-anchored ribosome-binding protein